MKRRLVRALFVWWYLLSYGVGGASQAAKEHGEYQELSQCLEQFDGERIRDHWRVYFCVGSMRRVDRTDRERLIEQMNYELLGLQVESARLEVEIKQRMLRVREASK